ncbi:ankyrin repeat domain-containing protein 12-like isoform X5 [Simochromis diagramma]|uniref:ankyrin repeat domain-containing protein 12-like isoform X5 n=1 Tax=Simochromis diagramma TaxID=43689 RepID=UPI001A7EB22E|nr:ankyrin repeat domain-containing protein 12-like isoform X5 [Simochromis diagramma]
MSLLESTRQLFSSTSLANRYHGLINQGATDYLNSVLQVMFMTKDFREAVTRYSGGNPHSEFLDHHLKVLFDDLQNHTAYSYKITQKLGIDNVYEQRDAAECLERVLRMTSPDASKIFHGQLVNKTTCSKGHIQTDRDAPFWLLPLSLVDSCSEDYSVVKGIEEFFKPSDFCGENQMYCEQCDDKVDATMRDVIKHHPDVLCLLLKRFEFNYNYMSHFKITCSVEVPYTLQMPESQKYELYAFLDHFGDLRGGHYSATIKIQEEHGDRWYQFDDTRVTELDFQPFQLDNTERSQTTYLLFYSKKKDTGTPESTDVSTSGLPTISNEYDQSHDGKNKSNRKRKVEKTDTADNPKTARLREAGGSPDTPCNVDPLDKEPNEDKGTTGSDDLDQKHTEVDDAEKNRPDINIDFKLDSSDRSAVCDDLSRQYEMSKLMDDKAGNDEKAKDKQSEKKSHAEHPADTVGENICEHQENKQICSPSHAEEKTKTDFQHETKGKISADKPTAEMCCDTFQDKEKVDDRKENILQDDQSHKNGNRHSDTLNMQEISVTHSSDNDVCVEREIRDVKEDRRERKGDEKGDHSKFEQNTVEEVSGAATTQKDVDVEEKKEHEGNTKQIQIREKPHLRPAGAEIIEAPKENQDDATNEKTKAESFQLKARPKIQGVTEGRRGSQKSGKVITNTNKQITCEENRQNSQGECFGTKMKNTGIETVGKPSQDSFARHVKYNEGHTENKSQTKSAAKPREEEKQHGTKGKISADKPTAEMCCDTFQDKEKVDDRKENILQDDQSHKHGNRHSDTLNMQEISVTRDNNVCVEREIRDVKEDRRERKGGKKGDHSKFEQNTVEEVSGAATTQKDVDVEEKKEYEGNTKQIQIREKPHLRPAGAEIIEAPKENQDDATNEKTKAESFQLKARPKIQGVTEGGRGSQKSGKVQITCEENRQTPDFEIIRTKMKNMRIETVGKPSQGSSERCVKNNEGVTENKSQTTNAAKPRRVELNDASLPEQQKRRTKREERKHHDTNYPIYTKTDVDDVEIEAAKSSGLCSCFVALKKYK